MNEQRTQAQSHLAVWEARWEARRKARQNNGQPDGTASAEVARNNAMQIQFSDTDADLSEARWRIGSPRSPYATADMRIEGRAFKLLAHRIVLRRMAGRELLRNELTDHINGNGLDNRRENLRLVDHRGNGQNRQHSWSGSGFFGVTKYRGKWICRLFGQRNGKTVRLFEKYFPTAELAALEYNRQAEIHGYLTRNKL